MHSPSNTINGILYGAQVDQSSGWYPHHQKLKLYSNMFTSNYNGDLTHIVKVQTDELKHNCGDLDETNNKWLDLQKPTIYT